MKWKVLKIRFLVPFVGLLAILIFTTTYFVRRRKRCHIVYEKANPIAVPVKNEENKLNNNTADTEDIPKPTVPLLTVPPDIAKTIGSDEWISRTTVDTKRECPSLVNSKQTSSSSGCQIPDIDPFHPSVIKLLRNVPMPSCSRYKSYGKLVNGKIHFLDPSVTSATYRKIIRDGDFKYLMGRSVPVPATDTVEKIKDEFIEVEYQLKDGKNVVKETFLQPVPHEHLLARKAQKTAGMPLNILIIGIDSLSHSNAKRKLPKVYKYLKEELGAMMFNGHSIVGDGTTEQLAAMLTGLGELEQYESRRHHKNPKPVDGWSWIYKQLKECGYLTGYSGDAPSLGPFQYRLMGFKDPPTDFYTRPYYQMSNKILKGFNRCSASRTISKVQFDYIREVFEMFKNKLKFFFSFNVLYSHNANSEAAMIEPDLLGLLQDFKRNGQLNNTLLIVMGDHGARYGSARALLQGKQEERLPLFSMAFPSWFLEKYPDIAKTLRTNTNRLTSWYDVYATFRHMISYPELPANLKHGQSLFTEVPVSRTCAQAAVEEHWCPCLEWAAVSLDHSHVKKSALAAVEYMNNANSEHKLSAKNCQTLSLKDINYALLERPNEKMLSFKQTNDLLPAFSDKSKPAHKDFCRYQIQFTTSPNNGTYEATVRYHKQWFIVTKGISRVNKYGNQPECIARDLPHLRKFCLCKREVPNARDAVNNEIASAVQEILLARVKCS